MFILMTASVGSRKVFFLFDCNIQNVLENYFLQIIIHDRKKSFPDMPLMASWFLLKENCTLTQINIEWIKKASAGYFYEV